MVYADLDIESHVALSVCLVGKRQRASIQSQASTVQFRSICHPPVTVMHLTKFLFRHPAWRAVTRPKFRQMALTVQLFWFCFESNPWRRYAAGAKLSIFSR